ncbi:MAG: hypothetical protein A2202_07635 [Bdellovibrionales bacterium RIFOXYA1_FULL_36_14]|nr:MAG: hypothetical protein A2202_07635 [Bdellovibrionales bacterium RIFOXYA1_FULL_36_14]
MFYLNLFMRAIREHPLKGLSFIFLCGLFILVLLAQNIVNDFLQSKIANKNQYSYFYVLMSSNENHEDVVRKLRDLEEVKQIETLNQEVIAKEVKKILSELDVNVLSPVLDMDYVGFKIIFALKTSIRSQQLVREYVERLVDKKNLILGDIKDNISDRKASEDFLFRKSHFVYPFILLSVISLWLIFFISVKRTLAKIAYLVEQYQRRRQVLLKTLLIGVGSWLVFFIIVFSFIPQVNHLNIIGAALLVLITFIGGFKKDMWES